MKPWLLSICVFVGALVVVEFSLGAIFAFNIGRWHSASALTEIFYGRPSNKEKALENCKEIKDLWTPSPLLGYVRSGVCPHTPVKSNSLGFVGEEPPVRNDSKIFHILLTGGSVAERMGLLREGNLPYLEAKLNQNYHPPSGELFKIVIGAMADYRLPQQISIAMFHQQVVDGWIDVSGFNELSNYRFNRRLEFPSVLYQRALGDGALVKHAQEIDEIRANILKSPWRHSFIALKVLSYQMYLKTHDREFVGKAWQPETLKYQNGLPEAEQFEINLNQHQGYLRLMASQCKTLGWSCAFFIQPIPHCDKPIHPKELSGVSDQKDKYCADYRRMEAKLLATGSAHSLLKIFSKSPEHIYEDDCHMNDPNPYQAGPGSVILVNTIVKTIGQSWKLRSRR